MAACGQETLIVYGKPRTIQQKLMSIEKSFQAFPITNIDLFKYNYARIIELNGYLRLILFSPPF